MGSAYDFHGRFDVERVSDGVVVHVPEPGERHILVPQAEWEALIQAVTPPAIDQTSVVPDTKPEEPKRAETPRPTAAHKAAGDKRK